MLDLLVEEHALVNVVSFNQSEPNLRQLLTHPLCSVISDGFYVKGKAHPRLYGTFPELLGNVVRDRGWMPLPESIHKITAKPAARLGLKNRGWLKKGYSADVTIFDPAHVKSEASYETPDREPQGILKVIKEGQIVYQAG
jgi:N-acyl-D-amino-acid deacylase